MYLYEYVFNQLYKNLIKSNIERNFFQHLKYSNTGNATTYAQCAVSG